MTLLQLRYFETLARVLHYTRASQELNISQPSLSYAMNELEFELGVKLFSKDNRRISLTVYGERFLPYVRQALATVDEGVALVQQMSSAAPQTVRMGYVQSLSSSLVPAIIQDIHEKNINENMSFQFTEDTSSAIFEMLKNNEIDMAFCMHRDAWAESVPVMRQPLYLAVSVNHPLAESSAVSLDDFIREPLVMLDKRNSLRSQFDQILEQRSIIPHIAFEVHSCNTALQYVALNFGVSVLPHVPAMDDERISVIPIFDEDREISRTVYLSWSKNCPLSLEAHRVISYIAENHSISV